MSSTCNLRQTVLKWSSFSLIFIVNNVLNGSPTFLAVKFFNSGNIFGGCARERSLRLPVKFCHASLNTSHDSLLLHKLAESFERSPFHFCLVWCKVWCLLLFPVLAEIASLLVHMITKTCVEQLPMFTERNPLAQWHRKVTAAVQYTALPHSSPCCPLILHYETGVWTFWSHFILMCRDVTNPPKFQFE